MTNNDKNAHQLTIKHKLKFKPTLVRDTFFFRNYEINLYKLP